MRWPRVAIVVLAIGTMAFSAVGLVERVRNALVHAAGEKTFATASDLKAVRLWDNQFIDQNGRPPNGWDEFLAFIERLPDDSRTESRDRISRRVDAWGRQLHLFERANKGGRMTLRSAGANGRLGDDDDLVWREADGQTFGG